MVAPANSRARALAAAALLGLASCADAAQSPSARPAESFDPRQSDPRAVAVADVVMDALGGKAAWDQTRFIHFAFAVQKGEEPIEYRTHLWDKWSGRLRYENIDKEGRPVVVLLNVDTREGAAYRGSERLPAAGAKPLLDEAYEAWINDTYWLLMPYKMKDPGVRLRYAGETQENGAIYDRVELSFDQVGLTPRDRYWAHVNRTTRIMDRWSYILQDDPPGSEPTVWDWKGWTRRGRILLSPEKVSPRPESDVRILHPIMDVYDALPDSCFETPGPLPAGMGARQPPSS